jgi:hypothetical protein
MTASFGGPGSVKSLGIDDPFGTFVEAINWLRFVGAATRVDNQEYLGARWPGVRIGILTSSFWSK